MLKNRNISKNGIKKKGRDRSEIMIVTPRVTIMIVVVLLRKTKEAQSWFSKGKQLSLTKTVGQVRREIMIAVVLRSKTKEAQ